MGDDELRDLLQAAYDNGIEKVQWTGGECTITNLPIIANIAKGIGFTEQALTSNGVLLDSMLDELVAAGLNRANISLDSLSRNRFQTITGMDRLGQVLNSIEHAAMKLEMTKINVAVINDNIDEIDALLEYAGRLGPKVILKLHELWRFKPEAAYQAQHVSVPEIMRRLSRTRNLAVHTGIRGNNPTAKYYSIAGTGQIVGVSGIPTHFKCGGPSCSKLRVYANGRTCDGKYLAGVPIELKRAMIAELIEKRSTSSIERDSGHVEPLLRVIH